MWTTQNLCNFLSMTSLKIVFLKYLFNVSIDKENSSTEALLDTPACKIVLKYPDCCFLRESLLKTFELNTNPSLGRGPLIWQFHCRGIVPQVPTDPVLPPQMH